MTYGKKIIVSPGYGAGWASWNTKRPGLGKFLAEYQPLIEAIEAGEDLRIDEINASNDYAPVHPMLIELQKEVREKFGNDATIFFGGLNKAKVRIVHGRYRITDREGYEKVEEDTSGEWW